MSNGVTVDADAIRKLAEILRDTDLTEIEVAEKDARIRVARVIPAPAPAQYFAAPAMAPMQAMATAAPAQAASVSPAVAPAASAPTLDASHPGLVTSPMVGVAYLSPEPGAPAYITLGAKVTAGQTLLLIEAMKTFNQIKAQKAGTVTRILIDNGTPVEYGEPLVLVE
ncbi:acetyl-CoA carboxylase biotin carboxyl carrier protein [Sabulicella glaciei]|uniref:Biotin carboxyl carrier protein of acetyl-CoA carboxylase n=1 Tax=Sabulicella glaciei TaxID=2984948 RepID=A0ABT3P0E3_9PROT|nr:acetyl-CoA carboxylase biotin carboxyl carrier protein [Roseococcus sp. MDT2-1-1]MCW8087889.1 acetyl-CoA carboxylase biotin carboxyl carrier protein [Roseococcus sp. MDT2-1-1]